MSSAESNVETQENRATDERLSSDSASESEDTSDDDDDDLNADVDMDHDVESRNTSVYTSSQKTGRTSENRVRCRQTKALCWQGQIHSSTWGGA